MGSYDRDYAREEAARRAGPGLPVVTKWLLIANIGIFLIDAFSNKNGAPVGPLSQWGCFTVASAFGEGRIWEFLTFQFLHASVGHVLFNSIGIYFFGPLVERWWGTKRFLIYYLICGAAGALFYTLLLVIGLLPNAGYGSPLVGASAGVFGMIFAVVVIAPAGRVRLLIPPIELSMRQLAMTLGGIAVGMIAGALLFPDFWLFGNAGGEAGHLGGAIAGLILMKYPRLLGGGGGDETRIIRPGRFRRHPPKLKPRSKIDPMAVSEIDRILDKVSEQGFGSLSDAERKTLEEASRRNS